MQGKAKERVPPEEVRLAPFSFPHDSQFVAQVNFFSTCINIQHYTIIYIEFNHFNAFCSKNAFLTAERTRCAVVSHLF